MGGNMNTKEIEVAGMQALDIYFEHKGFNKPTWMTNKGCNNLIKSEELPVGCDAIINSNNVKIYLELKASESAKLPTNIRFTHQTIATMHNAGFIADMIVAYVYNLKEKNNPKFKFFRFGNIPVDEIIIEPHFIIQPNSEKIGKQLYSDFEAAVMAKCESKDLTPLFNKKVGECTTPKIN
jgi:hypothetical protein